MSLVLFIIMMTAANGFFTAAISSLSFRSKNELNGSHLIFGIYNVSYSSKI